ncbi:hypothetical protein SZ64_07315 [Erythrobacter sp. SG61-1L]|nr:hypothetical protein SZ64_07315 [Erythrobacter sp. SG61-1L]
MTTPPPDGGAVCEDDATASAGTNDGSVELGWLGVGVGVPPPGVGVGEPPPPGVGVGVEFTPPPPQAASISPSAAREAPAKQRKTVIEYPRPGGPQCRLNC